MCGIPQGSVLGPALWNIDTTTCCAATYPTGSAWSLHDTLVLSRGESYQAAAETATRGVATVVDRIQQLGLKVALHKSKAMCFHGPRTAPPPGSQITVGGPHRRRVDNEVPGTRPRQPVDFRGAFPTFGPQTGQVWGRSEAAPAQPRGSRRPLPEALRGDHSVPGKQNATQSSR
ncbi:hypothetical protein PYW07_012658 [Mythimna separata]|uniref:Reverse transcriptase domain-containing protein n=1 Tax=Mythimna separata TaxID=271217 RepID=A0AAD8DL16_MYTSE|nr:hypothetical protein PYW07_012658 [Mythimna separata]